MLLQRFTICRAKAIDAALADLALDLQVLRKEEAALFSSERHARIHAALARSDGAVLRLAPLRALETTKGCACAPIRSRRN